MFLAKGETIIRRWLSKQTIQKFNNSMQLLNIRHSSTRILRDSTTSCSNRLLFSFQSGCWLWKLPPLGRRISRQEGDYLALPGCHFTKHVESTMQQIVYRSTIIDAAGAWADWTIEMQLALIANRLGESPSPFNINKQKWGIANK